MFRAPLSPLKSSLRKSIDAVLDFIQHPFRRAPQWQCANQMTAPADDIRVLLRDEIPVFREKLREELRAELLDEIKAALSDPAVARSMRNPLIGTAFPFAAGTCQSGVTYDDTAKTTNRLPKFSSTCTLADSQIYDSGSSIGIGTTSPSAFFDIHVASASLMLSGSGSHAFALADGNGIPAGRFGNETGGCRAVPRGGCEWASA